MRERLTARVDDPLCAGLLANCRVMRWVRPHMRPLSMAPERRIRARDRQKQSRAECMEERVSPVMTEAWRVRFAPSPSAAGGAAHLLINQLIPVLFVTD